MMIGRAAGTVNAYLHVSFLRLGHGSRDRKQREGYIADESPNSWKNSVVVTCVFGSSIRTTDY
jgi:hypothetical protein